MIYESRAALESKLNERYDGPISQREGPGGRMFSYIPWTETVRRMNAVFGLDGWDTRDLKVIYNEGVYTVSLLLDVSAEYRETDTASGEISTGYFSKSVPGVGSAVARNQGDDNASKAALSDAISRAAKLLGDQFGFFLYEEKGNTQSAPKSNQPTQPRQMNPANTGTPASDAQIGFLKKLGYQGDTSGMTKGEASQIINELKQAQASGF